MNSIKNKQPKQGTKVITYNEVTGVVGVGKLVNGEFTNKAEGVTHWKYIPKKLLR